MEPLTIGILALIGLLVLIGLHVPIGAAIGIAGLVSYTALDGFQKASSIFGTEASSVFTNLEIAVIPLFLLMGNFATAGGLSADIYRLAYAVVGHYRGGLAVSTVFGCAGFGAICGSSMATAATMTQVSLPEMLQRGYDPALAAGSVAAGGTLGMLIPPSIVMVIYAFLTEQFVIALFLAAIVPGIIAVITYWIAIALVVRFKPEAGPPGPRLDWAERWRVIKSAWTVVMLVTVVAGGIYSGILTVTEAAAMGAILAFLIAFLRGRLSWAAFWKVLIETASNTAMLYLIILGANIFAFSIAVSSLPEVVVTGIKAMDIPPIAVIFMLLLMYLVLGSIFETISSIVVTLPFVFPLITELGFDPVWWGVMMVVMIEIGLITPPIGINVFVVQGIARDVPLRTVFGGIVPFLGADLVRLVLLVFFPVLTLWLPGLLI